MLVLNRKVLSIVFKFLGRTGEFQKPEDLIALVSYEIDSVC